MRMKDELHRSYYLCPETFDNLIQQQQKDKISFCNCFSSRTFWEATIICRECVKTLWEDFKLKCGACLKNAPLGLHV